MKTIKIIETGIGSIDVYQEEITKSKVYINNGEYTKDMMSAEDICENEVFVAATNMQGEHGGGSARFAYDKLGLEWGLGEGMSENGKVYAFPTLEFGASNFLEKISEERFAEAFETFKKCALENPLKKFYLTKIGLGIAGWDLWTVHKLFWNSGIPFECDNVIYPIELEIPTEDRNW